MGGVLKRVAAAALLVVFTVDAGAQSVAGMKGVLEREIDKASSGARTPADWVERARSGVESVINGWETLALELGAFDERGFRDIRDWSANEIEKRYASFIEERYNMEAARVAYLAARRGAQTANLEYMYESENGVVKIDESSGDPVVKYDAETFDADRALWREAVMRHNAFTIGGDAQKEFLREAEREERIFHARREYDVYSLRNKKDGEAALGAAHDLIESVESKLRGGLDALHEGIIKEETSVEDIGELGREWLTDYRAQFERGLQAWEAAEAEFFARRLEWEYEAVENYGRGEEAWLDGYRELERARFEWQEEAQRIYEKGEARFAEAEAQLREAVAEARLEMQREAGARVESAQERAGAYVESYMTAARLVSGAVENINFWADALGVTINENDYKNGAVLWTQNSIASELSKITASYRAMADEAAASEKAALQAIVSYIEGNAASVGTADGAARLLNEAKTRAGAAVADRFYIIDGAVERFGKYKEIEEWGAIYSRYLARADEARSALERDFALAIGRGAGGLAGILDGDSGVYHLDEYQAELLKVEAVRLYWERRYKIAEAVANYARDGSGARQSDGALTRELGAAKAKYDELYGEYAAAEAALREESRAVSEREAALSEKGALVKAAAAQLEALYEQYGEVMAAYITDGRAYFAGEAEKLCEALAASRAKLGEAAVYEKYTAALYNYDGARQTEAAGRALEQFLNAPYGAGTRNAALELLAAASVDEWLQWGLGDWVETAGEGVLDILSREKETAGFGAKLQKIKDMERAYKSVVQYSAAARQYDASRAIRGAEAAFTSVGLTFDLSAKGGNFEKAALKLSSLDYEAAGAFLQKLDDSLALLPAFLQNEGASWKAALVKYYGSRLALTGHAAGNTAALLAELQVIGAKIEAADAVSDAAKDYGRENALYISLALALDIGASDFEAGGVRRETLVNEAGRRIGRDLAEYYGESYDDYAEGAARAFFTANRGNWEWADIAEWDAAVAYALEKLQSDKTERGNAAILADNDNFYSNIEDFVQNALESKYDEAKETLALWQNSALYEVLEAEAAFALALVMEDGAAFADAAHNLLTKWNGSADEIWDAAHLEGGAGDTDIARLALRFVNGKTPYSIAERIITARVRLLANADDLAAAETEAAASGAGGASVAVNAALEAARTERHRQEKAAEYAANANSAEAGDIFRWSLAECAGDAEAASKLADVILYLLYGVEHGDYFYEFVESAVENHKKALTVRAGVIENILGAQNAAQIARNAAQNGAENWRIYAGDAFITAENLFDGKTRPAETGGANSAAASDEQDALEAGVFAEMKFLSALDYYTAQNGSGALKVYGAEMKRDYAGGAPWRESDIRLADYQFADNFEKANAELSMLLLEREGLGAELAKNARALQLSGAARTEKERQMREISASIEAQKTRYGALLADMKIAGDAFDSAARSYDAAYEEAKARYAAMEEARFLYEKAEAVNLWAGTAYLSGSAVAGGINGNYRTPEEELRYAETGLRRSSAALEALRGLYDEDAEERPYDDAEYNALYEKYRVSFAKLLEAAKAKARLNAAIEAESKQNAILYVEYRKALDGLSGKFTADDNFGNGKKEDAGTEDEKITYSFSDIIVVKNGKLAFNRGDGFSASLVSGAEAEKLKAYFTMRPADKWAAETQNETGAVSDFELALRKLDASLQAKFSGDYERLALARDYLLRNISGGTHIDGFSGLAYDRWGGLKSGGNPGGMNWEVLSSTQVHDAADGRYSAIEEKQNEVWASLTAEEREIVEFYTIVSSTPHTEDAFYTDMLVLRSLKESMHNIRENYLKGAGITYALGYVLALIPGAQAASLQYFISSGIFFGFYAYLGDTESGIGTARNHVQNDVLQRQNDALTNWASIETTLADYRASCDRLAVLIGEAPPGTALTWTRVEASFRAAELDETLLQSVKQSYGGMTADDTWLSSYKSSQEAADGVANWTKREKENTKRRLETEAQNDEAARSIKEESYNVKLNAWAWGADGSGETDDAAVLDELRALALESYGEGAAAHKRLFNDTASVTMGYLKDAFRDSAGFGDEYRDLANDYLSLISGAWRARYEAEITAREAEWQLALHGIQEKRERYREAAAAIASRGDAEWDAGLRRYGAAYTDWKARYTDNYEKTASLWDASYIAGLSEKEAWIERAAEAAENGAVSALDLDTEAGAWARHTNSWTGAGDALMGAREASTIVAEILGGAGLVNMKTALSLFGDGALSGAQKVRAGLGGAASLMAGAGNARYMAEALSREAKDATAEREAKRLAEMVRQAVERALQGFADTIKGANESFEDGMDNMFILGGLWERSGRNYTKSVIVNSTLFDNAVTERKTVESYKWYEMAESPQSRLSAVNESEIDNLDRFSAYALISQWEKEIAALQEEVFGTVAENADKKSRTVYLKNSHWETKTEWLDVFTQEVHNEQKFMRIPITNTVWVELEDDKAVVGAGEFGRHLGYAPFMKDGANPEKESVDSMFRHAGTGEQGRLLRYFQYYAALEGVGLSKMAQAAWDKTLWDDRSSWFKAPTLRNVTDIAVGIAATALTGGMGGTIAAAFASAGINLADDAVFALMDIGGGYKSWEQAGLDFGKQVVTSAVSAAGSFGGSVLQGKIADSLMNSSSFAQGLAKFTVQSTQTLTLGAANSAINAVQLGGNGGLTWDSRVFNTGLRSAATSVLVSGAQTASSGLINMGIEGLVKDAFKNTTAFSNMAGGFAAQGVNYAMGGDFTMNVANLGMIGTLTDKENLTQLLGGVGLEAHFGRDGASGRIGAGGVNVSVENVVMAAKGVVTYIDVNGKLLRSKESEAREYASAMRTLYSGDEEMKENFEGLLKGSVNLKRATWLDTEALSITDDASGIKTIFLGDKAFEEGGKFSLNVILGHEAHRNGEDDGLEGQKVETRSAVTTHAATAISLMNAYGVNAISDDMGAEAWTLTKAYLTNDQETIDKIMEGYDSSGDFWKRVVDANGNYSIQWDGKHSLEDENGRIIFKSPLDYDDGNGRLRTLAKYNTAADKQRSYGMLMGMYTDFYQGGKTAADYDNLVKIMEASGGDSILLDNIKRAMASGNATQTYAVNPYLMTYAGIVTGDGIKTSTEPGYRDGSQFDTKTVQIEIKDEKNNTVKTMTRAFLDGRTGSDIAMYENMVTQADRLKAGSFLINSDGSVRMDGLCSTMPDPSRMGQKDENGNIIGAVDEGTYYYALSYHNPNDMDKRIEAGRLYSAEVPFDVFNEEIKKGLDAYEAATDKKNTNIDGAMAKYREGLDGYYYDKKGNKVATKVFAINGHPSNINVTLKGGSDGCMIWYKSVFNQLLSYGSKGNTGYVTIDRSTFGDGVNKTRLRGNSEL